MSQVSLQQTSIALITFVFLATVTLSIKPHILLLRLSKWVLVVTANLTQPVPLVVTANLTQPVPPVVTANLTQPVPLIVTANLTQPVPLVVTANLTQPVPLVITANLTQPRLYSSPCLRRPLQPAATCHVRTVYSCTDHFSIAK